MCMFCVCVYVLCVYALSLYVCVKNNKIKSRLSDYINVSITFLIVNQVYSLHIHVCTPMSTITKQVYFNLIVNVYSKIFSGYL